MRGALLVLLAFVCPLGVTDIYKWVDNDGQVHYGDNSEQAPADAETIDPGPVNTVPTPTPPPVYPDSSPHRQAAPKPNMTPARWAGQKCIVKVRILYTDGRFIPCVPTDEVPVYICEAEVPQKYGHFFGRRYRYENRESECGPEVYEGEILYLKKR
jgi:hypothetical protein